MLKNIYKRLKKMKKTAYWDNPEDCQRAQEIVSNGKVLLGDSDTVAGLYAALSAEGCEQLNRIKSRHDKPYLIMIGDPQNVENYAYVSETVRKLLQAFWPGPLTVILSAREGVPSYMKSSTNTIAFRVPDNKDIRDFVRSAGGLFSTSANLTGCPVPEKIEEVDPRIVQQVEMIMRNRIEHANDTASTIVDCSTDTCRIIREGMIEKKELERWL
jgi:L-threonylcarbamoyladenylate synthase